MHALLSQVRTNISRSPKLSAAVYALSSAAPFITAYPIIALTYAPPPELGIAFVLVRALKRVRIPVDMALAAAMAHRFPALKTVSLAALTPQLPQSLNWVKGSVDQYGVAFLLATRLNGVLCVLTLYGFLRSGVDASTWLSKLGLGDDAGHTMGAFAGAALLAGCLSPAVSAIAVARIPQQVHYAARFCSKTPFPI